MLVLSRKFDESIIIDGHIRITVLGIRGQQVRIGIEAPPNVRVVREELLDIPAESDAARGLRVHDVPVLAADAAPLGGPLSSAVNRLSRR